MLKCEGFMCPINFNPADYFVLTLAVIPGQEEECRRRIEKLRSKFIDSPQGQQMKNALNDVVEQCQDAMLSVKGTYSPYKSTWCQQFRAISYRTLLTMLREPMLLKVRMLQISVVALLAGAIFFGQVLNQEGVMNINGVLFLLVMNLSFLIAASVIGVFALEIPLFLREHLSGMYRSDTYFLARTIAELPLYLLLPVSYTGIVYWMVDLYPSWEAFFYAILISILIVNCACSFGYMLSTWSPSVKVAVSLTNPLLVTVVLFAGYLLNISSFPRYLSCIQYISWFRYGFEALGVNQWKNVDHIVCDRPNNTACVLTGHQVLSELNFNPDNFGVDFAFLVAHLIGYRLLAYLGLLYRARQS